MNPELDTTTANSTAAYGDLSKPVYAPATYGPAPFPWATAGSSSGPAGGGGGGSWGGPNTSAPAPVAPSPVGTAPVDVRSQQLAQLNAAETQLQGIQQQLNQRTIGDSLGDFTASSPTTYTPQTPFDEDAARKQAQREQLRLHQAEIDATNQIYDQQLAEARLQGQGRIGSTRAMGARGGILGSDFAASQKQGQIAANTAEQRAIQAERQAKIGSIMGNVRDSVLKQMEDKRAAYQLGADAVLANITGQSKAKQDNINLFAQDLLTQGIDINDLSPEELQAFASESGVPVNDLITGYQRAKAAATTEADTKKYTLKAGETLVNAAGEEIASVPGEDVVYKEGDVIKHADGTTTKIGKTTAGGGTSNKVYSAKNLPGDVRSEILDDLTNSQAAKDGTLDVQTLLLSYPEVDTETVQELYDTFYAPPAPKRGGADENIWTFWK